MEPDAPVTQTPDSKLPVNKAPFKSTFDSEHLATREVSVVRVRMVSAFFSITYHGNADFLLTTFLPCPRHTPLPATQ